jgi:hypothetical protein
MNRLFLESTKATPRVEFLPSGELSIQGRSLPEDTYTFYTPLLDWAKQCLLDTVSLEIRLEYINTSSSKQLYTLICLFKDNLRVKNFSVQWYYEEGDEDGLETGKEFESMLKVPFQFHEYAEVVA